MVCHALLLNTIYITGNNKCFLEFCVEIVEWLYKLNKYLSSLINYDSKLC